MAQNHQQVSLTHDGQQNADINFQILTAHIQKVVTAKALQASPWIADCQQLYVPIT